MNKDISKTKLFLSFISLVITFFVWQQGLRDSLNRPSISFDISQKEKEIAELALPAVPIKLKSFLFVYDPIEEINSSLSEIPFNQLTERNKLIWVTSLKAAEKIFTEGLNELGKKQNLILFLSGMAHFSVELLQLKTN